MAVRRGQLRCFLDTGDDVGCVDGLWLLRVLVAVEFEEDPIQWSVSVNSTSDFCCCERRTYCLARLACTLSARLNKRYVT